MTERDPHSAYQRAEQVKRRHQIELLSKTNVIGVGVGLRTRGGVTTDEVVIVVMVSKKVSRSDLPEEQLIPAEIDGIPVDVQEVGWIEPHT